MSDGEGPITARSLMKTDFRTIESDRPLREAMELLLDFGDQRPPLPVVVMHADGSFAGLITPRALFKGLLRKLRPEEVAALPEPDLLAAMDGQLDLPVAEAMVRDMPRAYLDDRLITLMKINCEHRQEFTPVLEDDRVLGIIYLTDIFHAAASLAITHDAEGIELPPDEDEGLSH
ncbi:MAG: CBS domain-containing protein [Akkermansiaceae bacterium]|nr:CBS domain-containing protein [Akkermansiaceae bacterium]NNM31210.1 CBS domain-containing protein [Akkermansiaceae bacterium]